VAADLFAAEARHERLTRTVGLVLLLAFLGALVFLAVRTGFGDERPVEGVVLQIGTYAYETGDMPILTVRLNDGSTRQLRFVSWTAVNGCKLGSRISLLQQGSRLRVGVRGCYPRR
jgi:hypothetical protein